MENNSRKKKFTCIATGIVLALLLQNSAMAAGTTTINFKGNVTATPCTAEASKVVDFGDIDPAGLAAPGSWTAPKSFTIELTNCPATTTKITSAYSGTPSRTTMYFAGGGTAAGVAVQLKIGSSGTILGNGSTRADSVVASTHSASLAYDVYLSNDLVTGAIGAGTVNSIINVTFTYS
jgi:minor fimbrial subunit